MGLTIYLMWCSTTKQEQSVEGQREAIAKYAEAEGYNLIRWYTGDGAV